MEVCYQGRRYKIREERSKTVTTVLFMTPCTSVVPISRETDTTNESLCNVTIDREEGFVYLPIHMTSTTC